MTPAQPDQAISTSTQNSTGSFADLGVPEALLLALSDLGYERPSEIQAATIPLLMEGRDVIGLAQTGTGKTAAFALPILASLDLTARKEGDDIAGPKALVLSPTRELALQVSEAFESYAAHLGDVRLLPVYGGQGYGPQLAALRRGVDVVVGTPGRIMDHLERGRLDLSGLTHLVLDEADEMLNMGFAEDVETILAHTPASKQVALFSATMPPQIRELSARYLQDPAEITVQAATKTNQNITQRAILVAGNQKLDALTRILEVEQFDAVIVFVRTRTDTERVAEKLRARGFSASPINGDIPQQMRERIITQLRDGALDVLVATDVAARGLDVTRVTHVINFDLPIDKEAYVHRIGRTGRAGRSGDAISLITPRERRYLGAIEQSTGQPITMVALPSVADINETRLGRFDDAISAALEQTDRITEFRDIIAHYVRHHDVPEADVAAALAVIGQGDEPLLLDAADEIDVPELYDRKPKDRPRDNKGKYAKQGSRGRRADGHYERRANRDGQRTDRQSEYSTTKVHHRAPRGGQSSQGERRTDWRTENDHQDDRYRNDRRRDDRSRENLRRDDRSRENLRRDDRRRDDRSRENLRRDDRYRDDQRRDDRSRENLREENRHSDLRAEPRGNFSRDERSDDARRGYPQQSVRRSTGHGTEQTSKPYRERQGERSNAADSRSGGQGSTNSVAKSGTQRKSSAGKKQRWDAATKKARREAANQKPAGRNGNTAAKKKTRKK
mgnify:CR=1 FL=1